MFNLIHVQVARELEGERRRAPRDVRARGSRAHRRQVARVRSSLLLVPGSSPDGAREA